MDKENLKINAYYEIDIRHSDNTRETLTARYLGNNSLGKNEFQIGINRKTAEVLLVRRKISWLERILKSNIIKAIKIIK